MNEEDLRVIRTRRLLQEAFVSLVSQHGYDQVTIREITKEAQIGYKTFFRHYKSKEGLLEAITAETVATFEASLLPPDAPTAPIENTLTALRFAKAHKPLFLAIIHSPSARSMSDSLKRLGMREGIESFGGSGMPDDLVATHFASSMVHLIQWWLENDHLDVKEEEMLDYIDRLLIKGVQSRSD